jgi:hypothetical protein
LFEIENVENFAHLFFVCKIVYACLFSTCGLIFLYVLVFPLSMMVDSMEFEIFLENGVVPLVIHVNDGKVVVHDQTFAINFKLQISSILLEKMVLNFMGKVA